MKAAGPLLVVDNDPLEGLEKIGRASQTVAQAQIVGVTGSVGKTSAKCCAWHWLFPASRIPGGVVRQSLGGAADLYSPEYRAMQPMACLKSA